MDDGQDALDAAIAAGRFRGRILPLDELAQRGTLSPQDLTGLAIRLHYTDAEGEDSSRWVTIQSLSGDKLTAYGVAAACRVPRTRIERLAREETPVTADTALRLGRYFGTGPEFWLNLQSQHDLARAAQLTADLERIVPLNAA